LEKFLDFAGPILQHYGLSEFACPPTSFVHIPPSGRTSSSPSLPVAPTGRRLTRRVSPLLARGAGGPPEMSKKTLETGPLRAVSDTTVRSCTGGSRNFLKGETKRRTRMEQPQHQAPPPPQPPPAPHPAP